MQCIQKTGSHSSVQAKGCIIHTTCGSFTHSSVQAKDRIIHTCVIERECTPCVCVAFRYKAMLAPRRRSENMGVCTDRLC